MVSWLWVELTFANQQSGLPTLRKVIKVAEYWMASVSNCVMAQMGFEVEPHLHVRLSRHLFWAHKHVIQAMLVGWALDFVYFDTELHIPAVWERKGSPSCHLWHQLWICHRVSGANFPLLRRLLFQTYLYLLPVALGCWKHFRLHYIWWFDKYRKLGK